MVDAKEDVERLFSSDNLRQLFQKNENTICETHETYHCKRCNAQGKQLKRAPAMLYGDATTWNHLNHDALEKTNDHLLKTSIITMISVLHFNIFHIDLLHTCTYKTKTKSRIRSSGVITYLF